MFYDHYLGVLKSTNTMNNKQLICFIYMYM
jgi:hypothetical protein